GSAHPSTPSPRPPRRPGRGGGEMRRRTRSRHDGSTTTYQEAHMLTAIALIDTEADRIPEVAQAVAEIPGVSEVYSVTGDVDLIAMVRVREHEELSGIIADRIGKVAGV